MPSVHIGSDPVKASHPMIDQTARPTIDERGLRKLFDALPSGFALHEILLDGEGQPCDYRFIDVNPAFEAITGLSRSRLVGRRVREVLPQRSRSAAAARTAVDRALR